MARRHLFEFANQRWVPPAWRRYVTDYLQFMVAHGPFDRLRELVARLARETDAPIVDLCSGSGGPWPTYLEEPDAPFEDTQVILTDLHPNFDAFDRLGKRTQGRIRTWPEPVDAADVPEDLGGPRTIINGLHNFRPDTARAILADAVDQQTPIGVFEIMDRRPVTLLPLVFVPLFVLLLTPFVRPFRWGRLFWTYLVPVIPLIVFWDGLVSALRTYSPDELQELVDELDGFEWEIDSTPASDSGPARITYLIGRPYDKDRP